EKEFPERPPDGETLEYAITHYENNGDEISIDVESGAKGFLFISEIFYPGWRVYVNDEEKETLRANAVFRAVRIEEPSSRVKFAFRPLSFTVGRFVSSAAFAVMVLWIALSTLKKRSSRDV
ncbi:MAG: YfhO family protein, partial [Nitrospinales bacterium]